MRHAVPGVAAVWVRGTCCLAELLGPSTEAAGACCPSGSGGHGQERADYCVLNPEAWWQGCYRLPSAPAQREPAFYGGRGVSMSADQQEGL